MSPYFARRAVRIRAEAGAERVRGEDLFLELFGKLVKACVYWSLHIICSVLSILDVGKLASHERRSPDCRKERAAEKGKRRGGEPSEPSNEKDDRIEEEW